MGGPENAPAQQRESTRVLLVDDEEPLRRALARMLAAEAYEVVQAGDGRAALEELARGDFDVVVSDVKMPHMSGLELLRAIRQRDLELPVILLTGGPTTAAALEAKRHGALHYLTKPVDKQRLLMAVARAARLRHLAVAKRMAMDALGSLLPRAGDKAGLEASFDSALTHLWMAYQPIIRASDRGLHGYEALMRSKESSLPHPGAILDAAERLGRIHDVGRRVRGIVAAPVASMPADAFLFVNLHAADLGDETLFDPQSPLARIASRVVLELTERATLEGVDGAERRVAQLREMGFQIAIDDLGAGYAGLTSFALLEPQVVKLDMTLVRDVDKLPTKAKLIQSVCSVCRDLGVTVVAEGIETRTERDRLIELGCDMLQGYLHARPGPAFPPFTWGD